MGAPAPNRLAPGHIGVHTTARIGKKGLNRYNCLNFPPVLRLWSYVKPRATLNNPCALFNNNIVIYYKE